ncbi:hypothetical protein QJS04_geneDACA016872 [Acorus gramineus]|uniref:Uncharacterized protein n=1 Tax=Acorus gramineus TaxID=55184 RepID=A0AAV9BL99_ACOGR|nr:hypothetical protein QJS04_geneDACA016872 [Acorus gramineus]
MAIAKNKGFVVVGEVEEKKSWRPKSVTRAEKPKLKYLTSSWRPRPQGSNGRGGFLPQPLPKFDSRACQTSPTSGTLGLGFLPPPVQLNASPNRPRMQVIFLKSCERNSAGTGVFLPRGRGVSVDIPSEKPVYSPILIPYELVQSLNLNVYALEMQLASFIGTKKLSNNECRNTEMKMAANSYAEISLPDEWSY